MIQTERPDPKAINKKFKHLWHLVGNTPMLEILYEYKGNTRTIYVKCEHYNLTGSIKDRMALYILQRAYATGILQPGNSIVEVAMGNSGISFSSIGRILGHPVTIFMPAWVTRERTDMIKGFGGNVKIFSKSKKFMDCIELTLEMAAKDPNVFLPQQFENVCNAEAHQKTTGPEIWKQLENLGLKPDAFVAGVGTGGTIMGVGNYLKKKNTLIQVHPVEPKESPTLSVGYKVGNHRIQGISDEFIPPIVKLDELADVIPVHDGDAILMAQKMAMQLGIGVGISSGANVLAAIQVQNMLGDNSIVVTVLPDSNKKYLNTDLMKTEPVREGYLSADVQLLDYIPVKKAYAV